MRITERLGLVKRLTKNDLEINTLKKRQDEAIISAMKVAFSRIQPYRNALINKIEAIPNITVARVKRLTEYDDLLMAAASESARFNSYVSVQLDVGSLAAFELAASHVFEVSKTFGFTPTIIPSDKMDLLKKYLMPEGELMKSIAKWAPKAVERIRFAVIEGVQLGYNPRKIAAEIVKAYGGNLTDALRMTRTTQIWSYREATRANYLANSNVYKGWIWWAALDERTCMSCIAQHGSIHPLTEALDDHYNGRCAMLPYPQGMEVIDRLGRDQTGLDWFNKQNEAVQRKQMGTEFYDAWKAGKFEFSQLSSQVDNKIFGTMHVESTLKDLVNE
jgi:hypothetical protein